MIENVARILSSWRKPKLAYRKNHEKTLIYFHLAKMTIWNIKKLPNMKNYRNFVRKTYFSSGTSSWDIMDLCYLFQLLFKAIFYRDPPFSGYKCSSAPHVTTGTSDNLLPLCSVFYAHSNDIYRFSSKKIPKFPILANHYVLQIINFVISIIWKFLTLFLKHLFGRESLSLK